MDCPKCKGLMKVVDSRTLDGEVIRRRKCIKCKYTLWTIERVSDTTECMDKIAEYWGRSRRKVKTS